MHKGFLNLFSVEQLPLSSRVSVLNSLLYFPVIHWELITVHQSPLGQGFAYNMSFPIKYSLYKTKCYLLSLLPLNVLFF